MRQERLRALLDVSIPLGQGQQAAYYFTFVVASAALPIDVLVVQCRERVVGKRAVFCCRADGGCVEMRHGGGVVAGALTK